jgi:hypothetical protein
MLEHNYSIVVMQLVVVEEMMVVVVHSWVQVQVAAT